MDEAVSTYIAKNVKQLREARSLTQVQVARLSGVPRPTWANLESGGANPTVAVLVKVAAVLQVPIEELLSPPRAEGKLYPSAGFIPRIRGGVAVRRMLPDHIQTIEFDRMEFAPGSRLTGVPHRSGTREYLICEEGQVEIVVSGQTWKLASGDVFVFRGDQRHSYSNPNSRRAVAFSIVLLGATAAR